MGPAFFKGYFCRPAGHKREDDIKTRKTLIGSKVEASFALASRVSTDEPSQRQGRTASTKAMPPTSAAAPLDLVLAFSIPAHSGGLPLRLGIGQDLIPSGKTIPHNPWAAFPARRVRGQRFVETRI